MYAELRAEDFRAVFHLLGECIELWCDPAAWQQHLLAGIAAHIHLEVGLRAEVAHFSARETPVLLGCCEHGWASDSDREIFRQGMQRGGPFSSLLDRRFRTAAQRSRGVTLRRADLLPRAQWRGSEAFALCHRPAHMEEMLFSALPTPAHDSVHLLVFGGAGHQPTARDCQFLDLLHRELLPLLGAPLATERDFSLHGLSPRRREICALACAGLPEKTIADRLGLRPSTVNEALQFIHAHFGVQTQPQLMAYLLACRPRGRGPG